MSVGDEETKVRIIHRDLGPQQRIQWQDKPAVAASAANPTIPQKDRSIISCSLSLGVQVHFLKSSDPAGKSGAANR